MNLLVSLTGLITGLIEALILRIWLRHIQLSWLIIAGAFLGSWITYLTIVINPNIFNPIFKAIWSFLWEPLGFGALRTSRGKM
jgi:hypothetical protein